MPPVPTFDIIIRADAGPSIGSGHAMRCRAIAAALRDVGARVLFASSDDGIAPFIRDAWPCEILPADPMRLTSKDGTALVETCRRSGVRRVLVDSYGVTPDFFSAIATAAPDVEVTYIDDQWSFPLGGRLREPVAWDVSCVVNYMVYANEPAYRRAYAGSVARLCLGPAWTPLGEAFGGVVPCPVGAPLREVLVTTGSTNPDGTLERFAEACLAESGPGVTINVAVGALSGYGGPHDGRVRIVEGALGLAPVMRRCQAAVCAAGTTLYELCALRIPTCAFAMVDNQRANLEGFVRWGCCLDGGGGDGRLEPAIGRLLGDASTRERLSQSCDGVVARDGAQRIAKELMNEQTQRI